MRRLEQRGAVAFTCMAVAVGILALPPNCLGNRDHLRKYFPKASAGLFARAKRQSPIKAVIHLLRCVIDGLKVFEPFRRKGAMDDQPTAAIKPFFCPPQKLTSPLSRHKRDVARSVVGAPSLRLCVRQQEIVGVDDSDGIFGYGAESRQGLANTCKVLVSVQLVKNR